MPPIRIWTVWSVRSVWILVLICKRVDDITIDMQQLFPPGNTVRVSASSVCVAHCFKNCRWNTNATSLAHMVYLLWLSLMHMEGHPPAFQQVQSQSHLTHRTLAIDSRMAACTGLDSSSVLSPFHAGGAWHLSGSLLPGIHIDEQPKGIPFVDYFIGKLAVVLLIVSHTLYVSQGVMGLIRKLSTQVQLAFMRSYWSLDVKFPTTWRHNSKNHISMNYYSGL